jgi:hypothetical protein
VIVTADELDGTGAETLAAGAVEAIAEGGCETANPPMTTAVARIAKPCRTFRFTSREHLCLKVTGVSIVGWFRHCMSRP